jgi:RHS repeat-associated protein
MAKILSLFVLLALPFGLVAQTGLPPFGSFSNLGFETVNNQNLNVTLSIPIMSAPGRGLPLNLNLTYNSVVWQKVANAWFPVTDAQGNPTWGWIKDFPAGGSISYSTHTTNLKCPPSGPIEPVTYFQNYLFVDALGTTHGFPVNYSESACSAYNTGTYAPAQAIDPSGYRLTVAETNPIVLGPGGRQLVSGTSTASDINGNYVTKTVVNSTETDWKDSTGVTALLVLYNFATNPTEITYRIYDVNDAQVNINMLLAQYPIKTSFGCGVTEYTGTANLPFELDIPSPTGGTLKYTFSYEPSSTGYYTGRLKRVTLPTGGYYEYDYTGSNDGINCSDGSTLGMNRTVSDGTSSAIWNFVRNTTNLTTTVTTPALADTSSANDQVYTYNTLSQETAHKIYANSPGTTLLRTINTTWAANGTPATVTTILEDNSTKSELATTYDSNGILQTLVEYDWGTGTPNPIRTTQYSYSQSSNSNYTVNNVIGLVTSKSITDTSGIVEYRQDTAYDGSALTCPTGAVQHDDTGHLCTSNYRGNPTAITTYTSPANQSGGITKNFTYDWFGNLLTAQLNCCQTKTWTYSSATQYSQPDSIKSGTSPSLTTTYTYNLYLGLATKSTDPNNLATSYSYDFLRRPTQVSQANGLTSGESITYTYDDVNFKTTVKTVIDPSNSVQQISAADKFGRTVTTTIEDGGNNVKSIVQNEYNLAGRAYGTSNPYTTSAQYFTTTSFDVLGRPTTTTLPDTSKTTYSYDLNTVTVTDPAGKKRDSVFDAAGRLTYVFEPDPTTGNLTVQTSNSYNVIDELTTVASPQMSPLQTRTYSYDGLGRLLSTSTPEGGTTCFGSVTGSTCNADGYDAFDNLQKRTDARGVLTTYGYDGLNRLASVSYNVGSSGVPATPSVSLAYGLDSSCTSTHGAGCIGQLITMTDGPGSENYSYNSLEQMTNLQKIISGTTYTAQYAYNVGGELTSITYPSGRIVQQNIDSIGRLCSVGASGSTCTSGTTYATGYAYNAAQQITGFNYGNGVAASLGYSPDRLQLSSLSYAKSGTTLFGLTYAYGASGSNNGQISGITDSVDNGRSVNYTYDGLSRLANASTTGSTSYPAWGLQQKYDRFGNRYQQTISSGCVLPMTCPQPSVSISLGTNRITTGGYGYDANGNMTNDGSNTLIYDAENRTTSASNGSASGTYTYDGNSLRVKKVSGSLSTVYVFGGSKVIAEYDNGAAPTSPSREYIYSGGTLLARIAGSTTQYYHQDHLSNRLVTDTNGNVLEQMGHFPFGESWYNASGDKLQFTTYERDAESGNDYAMARYYLNRLGRFSSLDLLAGSISDPQSLNRFSYVENDPGNNSDPSGACIPPGANLGGGVHQGFQCPPNTDFYDDGSGSPTYLDLGQPVGEIPGTINGDPAAVGEYGYIYATATLNSSYSPYGNGSTGGIGGGNSSGLMTLLKNALKNVNCAALLGGSDKAGQILANFNGPTTLSAGAKYADPNAAQAQGLIYGPSSSVAITPVPQGGNFQNGAWATKGGFTSYVGTVFGGYSTSAQATVLIHEFMHAGSSGSMLETAIIDLLTPNLPGQPNANITGNIYKISKDCGTALPPGF